MESGSKGNEVLVEEEVGDIYYYHQHLDRAFKTEREGVLRFFKKPIHAKRMNLLENDE